MKCFQRSGSLEISLENLREITVDSSNNTNILDAIRKALNSNLWGCSINSISHTYELKAKITNKTSEVELTEKEKSGDTLKRTNEPSQLQYFTYEQLKKSATFRKGKYRGKLYGTVKLFSCNRLVDCEKCGGTGVCDSCNGSKQVVCPVCDGDKECVSCGGSGRYTCENCGGDGVCPECEEGWISCDDCGGDGTMCCPDCDGSGEYNVMCKKCDGTGTYLRTNKKCRACDGSGRFIRECNRCGGDGTVDCDNCDGDGGWDCNDCDGTGECFHCGGEGDFRCKACSGSGNCGKCKGKGKIWCPDCDGKGICFDCRGEKLVTCPRCNGSGKFQKYKEYTFSDGHSVRELISLSIEESEVSSITGDVCYSGEIYDFFAGRASVYNPEEVLNVVSEEYRSKVETWISIENNSTRGNIGMDYLNTHVELYKIPVSKFVLSYCNISFTILIVGNERNVYYDELPISGIFSFLKRFF